MNTHDIELPPLPDWADATLQGEDRASLFAWAEAAVKADRERQGDAAQVLAELVALIPLADTLNASASCQDLIDYFKGVIADRKRRGEPVAEGWQFVPKEPTPEMLAAFHSGFKNELHKNDRRRTMSAEEAGLRAMLNAAPQPAEPGRGEPVAEVVRDTCGGYSYIKWKTGYKAEVGDKLYLAPQPLSESDIPAEPVKEQP